MKTESRRMPMALLGRRALPVTTKGKVPQGVRVQAPVRLWPGGGKTRVIKSGRRTYSRAL